MEQDPFYAPDNDESPRIPFEARFDSECGACGCDIYEGDTVTWDGDDVVHTDCTDD